MATLMIYWNLASEEAGFLLKNFKSFLKEIKKSC